MCSHICIDYAKQWILPHEVEGKRVIDVGSYDVNGSFRHFIKEYKPSEWIGADLTPCDHGPKYGDWHDPCVTTVCSADQLINLYGENSFDYVITAEMMEHVENWKEVIHNLKTILKPGCPLLLTTRSPGFPYHCWPNDYWRYTVADMHRIFDDFIVEDIRPDWLEPGVFVKVRKPAENYVENDLTDYSVQAIGKP